MSTAAVGKQTGYTRERRQYWRQLVLLAAVVLSGCSDADVPLTPAEKIVRATLSLLAADGKSVCVDTATKGQTLFAFRQMMRAPRPSRTELGWHVPLPLRPPPALNDQQIYRGQLTGRRSRLESPDEGAATLPTTDQIRFNGVARQFAQQIDSTPGVTINRRWTPANVTARFWLLNRIQRGCQPNYILSSPIFDSQLGFIAVAADHWATIYALERRGSEWVPTARWSSWLY